MKSLFEPEAYTEIKQRLNTLSPMSEHKWGKMEVSQMVWHCKKPLELAMEKTTMKPPNFLMKMLFSFVKPSIYNDSPWKKGLPTAKEFMATEVRDFENEKAALENLVDEFHQRKSQTQWNPHPAFGKFTAAQWGQMQYKHLDHHFRQFGV